MMTPLFVRKKLCLVLISLGLSLSVHSGMSVAATDLADGPLANSTTTVTKPNIAFVLDDSGSMDDENMPDSDGTNKRSYCWKWYKYNTLAYNPAQTYKPPIKADGTRFPDAIFTGALKDGYFAAAAKMYNGADNNGIRDLTTLGTVTNTSATVNFYSLSSSKYYVSSVKVTLLDGSILELLDSAAVPNTSGTNNRDTLGIAVQNSINANTATGFSATYDSNDHILIITAPATQEGLTTTPAVTPVKVSGSNRTVRDENAFTTETLSSGYYYATHKTNPDNTSCSSNSSYNLVTAPSNIAAPGVTAGSAAALTNYANWYSYYRKRAFLMKAGVGEAFAALEQNKYRIGLFFINSINSGAGSKNSDLAIDTFAGTHRSNWFTRLYESRGGGYTPLRGALSRMGRMYAGKISGWDPVQYSCQRNYTILSTDGYWNTNNETTSYGPKDMDGTANVGDQDGATGVTKPELDSSKAQNTLADVAYYYYHNDLRKGDQEDGACNALDADDLCRDNVTPTGTNVTVDDVAQHQHMTTFTVGLGVNGTLVYQDDYKASTSGDYFDITQGSKNWPNPVNGTNDDDERIDDLWHAAVNGRGTYFSAKDPKDLAKGLNNALNSIKSSTGSGAAAATSNLQPTAGDDAIYIATYRTQQWYGELNAYTMALDTGLISDTPSWEASGLLKARIGSNGDSEDRKIYTADGTSRILFKVATGGLTTTQQAYFDNTKLSQYGEWSTEQKAAATPSLLVNYLRGHDRYEVQSDTYGTDHPRLYRDRQKVLGDIIHSQPIYVKASPYNYSDDGYSAFKISNASRLPTLYVAANDGMLHAFDATSRETTSGKERWAYVPPMVLPELWRLADRNYDNNHRFYLDGPLVVSDAYIGGAWKTVLIGAMGKGGRGYYALDVTNPDSPQPLWHFTADNNPNVGYSYGIPFITKLGDGTWVAVVTSGYNNIPEGGKYADADGKGYVFVLNLSNGSVIKTISTGVGTVANPAGLAKLNLKVLDFSLDNTAKGAYGGDLLGNMWRFDLDAGTATKLAALGTGKPIMTTPEIVDVEGKKVIYFGTGRYLGEDDLADTNTQSIFAIKDDGSTVSDLGQLVQQTVSGTAPARVVSKNTVDWATKYGWYINLPDSGERVTIDPQVFFGTLLIATTVPTASACQPGGYSWLYQLDYKTGGNVGTASMAAYKYTSPIVGLTVSKLPTGTPVTYPITADGQKPSPIELKILPPSTAGGVKRVLWRELFD